LAVPLIGSPKVVLLQEMLPLAGARNHLLEAPYQISWVPVVVQVPFSQLGYWEPVAMCLM
jgi:hypothetical protein